MPPETVAPGSVRSAATLNTLIRGLWPHPTVRLTDTERQEYAQLVAEWTIATAAERGDIVTAA
jgi:hypothetical protein